MVHAYHALHSGPGRTQQSRPTRYFRGRAAAQISFLRSLFVQATGRSGEMVE
jgi:hypothetical protein